MHVETRYELLIEEHGRIEAKLAAEMNRPLPDSFALQRLKREKLLLKDEIEAWDRLLCAIRVRPVVGADQRYS